MLGTLGHAIHSVDGTSDVGGVRSGFGANDGLIFGSLFMTRIVYLALYILVCIKIPLARVMLSKYAAAFAITSIMFLVATVAENEAVRVGFWIAALVIELLMYPVALMTPHEYQLTVNTAHLLERNQLWVILILGESIISLASADHTRTIQYYIVVLSAFLITYWLLLYYMKSQHLFDERAEEHALDHSPLLAFIFDTLQLAITTGGCGGGGRNVEPADAAHVIPKAHYSLLRVFHDLPQLTLPIIHLSTGMLIMAVGFKLAIQYAGTASSGECAAKQEHNLGTNA